MFFLGGFNTILPHLLYLAVFSVFLIIGLCGRANFSWDEITISKASLTSSISDYQSDPDLNSLPVMAGAEQPEKKDPPFTFRVEYIHFNCFDKHEFSQPPYGHYFRGPPSA